MYLACRRWNCRKRTNAKRACCGLLKDAARRKFDIILAWSVDRLGRSMPDLVAFLSEHALRIELYLHQQGLDTTTPAGKAMFQVMGVFAEFERAMIVERVRSGMARAKEKGTKSGKSIGRPKFQPVSSVCSMTTLGLFSPPSRWRSMPADRARCF